MKMIKPAKLKSRLRRVHRREQGLNLTMGLLLLCNWIAILFLVGFAIDWLIRLPVLVRMIILVPLLVFPIAKAWQSGWRFFRPWFSSPRTALKVEGHYQNLESLLVSGVQLSAPGAVSGTSAAMAALTVERANEAADQVDAEKVIPFKPIGVPGFLGGLLLASLCAFAAIDFPLFKTAATRLFTPWVAIEYPTRTQIEMVAGERIVKEGEGLSLVANISGEIPDSAKIILRTGKGKPRERTLAITGGVCEYEAKTVFRSFDYRISAGDARSEWQTVRVISAPRIERADVTLEFPEYTQRPAETVEALTLTVPEGTTIKWTLSLDRAVDEAEFRPAEGEAQALDISADGRSVTMQQVAAGSRSYSFGWVDKEHGFTFSSPRHYLQVAPDRAPSVELTSPAGNLFATLQRNLDFAFRGRDDHGIGEAAIAYRLNKAGEVKVALPAPELSDGSEQRIDWNYREALPDLAVGDTVTFAVELADRYPGGDGPHRVRSDARRVQFLSREDYLAQIEKQKRRLLTRIRTIYREERGVHDLVRRLDPSDDVFVQTCQLEAVRQGLIRERLGAIRNRINALVDDLEANKVAEEAESAAMVKLGTDLQTIADAHVGRAASLLRELATVTDGGGNTRNPAAAIDMVDSSARELGLVVLQLGFAEAADVMARELHATTQTQAALRLQTLIRDEADAAGDEDLAKAQTRLAKETARLLAATPRNKESTSTDALVAFNLSRMVNGLLRSGADAKMQEAAALIPKADSEKAARLQSEVIASLLRAEFRLRRGAEYEALTNARDLFAAQAAGQRKLREEGADMSAENLVQSQTALQRQVHLLLMPEVPAPRPKLYDVVAPPAPPVDDLLAAAEHAMQAALTQIEAGDREAAAGHHQLAQTAFEKLAEIAGWRMEAMTKRARMKTAVTISGKQATQLLTFEERLLALLEQTEDAADDEMNTAFLVARNQALADDAGRFLQNIVRWKEIQTSSNDDDLPLIDCLSRVARAVGKATPLLKENKPDDAIEFQEEALEALEEAAGLNEKLTATRTAFADVLSMAESTLAPSPLLVEIEAEQGHLSALTKKAKPEDRPSLVIPQKNLIHAVDAVVASLDPLAHKIESGTVMIFAKDDMDAAAIGLETDDIEDALDAQSFVVESLQELRAKIDDVTPQYRYVLEVTENLYEIVPQSSRIRTGTRQLLEKAEGAPDAAAVKTHVKQFGEQVQKLTGEEGYVATARQLENAIGSGAAGTGAEDALDALVADTESLQLLMDNLAYLIAPPLDLANIPEPTPEIELLEDVLLLAAHHKDLSRKTQTAGQGQLAEIAARQLVLASQCKALFPPPPPPPAPPVEPVAAAPAEDADVPAAPETGPGAEPEGSAAEAVDPEPVIEPAPGPAPPQPAPEPHPDLAAAHRHLSEAAARLQAGERDPAIARQTEAGDALRYFILEYALKHVMIPPPGPPQPPGPPIDNDEFVEQSILPLFEPGALTGDKPKGGSLEWQVLGRRDRAALNENFARELPLEYRAILKDYYERLTE
jgi:hypothetical protein